MEKIEGKEGRNWLLEPVNRNRVKERCFFGMCVVWIYKRKRGESARKLASLAIVT